MSKIKLQVVITFLGVMSLTSQVFGVGSSLPDSLCIEVNGCGSVNGKYTLHLVYDDPAYSTFTYRINLPSNAFFLYYTYSSPTNMSSLLLFYNGSSYVINDQANVGVYSDPVGGFTPNVRYETCTSAVYTFSAECCFVTPSISAQSNVSCNGLSNGSVSIDPNGGSSPYTYSWGGSSSVTSNTTGTITGLASGTYTVTVSDSKCSETIGVTITEPAPISIDVFYRPSSFDGANISTEGGSDGSIRTAVQGGSAPYTYSWQGPSEASGSWPQNLSAGSYFLEVTDVNGCTGSGGPFTLIDPLPIPPPPE